MMALGFCCGPGCDQYEVRVWRRRLRRGDGVRTIDVGDEEGVVSRHTWSMSVGVRAK